jgi:major membrane immunogen (membrane-anchored lipoprotein)
MKKIILLLVWVLILSFYQTATGAEQSALFLDNKAISGNVAISKGEHTITAVADGDMVLIAVYEDGMIKAVSTNKFLTYDFPSGGIEVKLFNWDKYRRPVSDVVCIKQNDIPETVYAGEAVCEPDEDEDFNEYLVKLEVVKVDGKITEIRNIDGYEYSGKQTSKTNLSFLKKAANKLVDKIIKKQSTKVDAISGATCASYAIMDAVDAALKSNPISTPKPTVTVSPELTIDDGTYFGTAQAAGK